MRYARLFLLVGAVGAVSVACSPAEAGPPGNMLGDEARDTTSHGSLVPELQVAQRLYSEAEYDSARTSFRNVARRAAGFNDVAIQAEALTWAGLASRALGDYQDSRTTGESALALKLDAGLGTQLWRSYNALGLLAWNEGRLFEATELFGQAIAVDAFEDPLDPVKTENNLGLVYTSLGDFDRARDHLSRALEGFQSAEEGYYAARVLTNLAALEIDVGDPASSLPWLERAMAAYQEADDPQGHQNAVGQWGSAHLALGDPETALIFLDSALSLSRRYELRQEEASNLELLAELHRDAGATVRALELYQEAAQINEELGLTLEAATDLRSQAELLSSLGSPASGVVAASRALELHTDIGAANESLKDLVTLARLNLELERGAEAREYLRTAQNEASRIGSTVTTVLVALAEARVLLFEGQPELALETLDTVVSLMERSYVTQVWEAHTLRAEALRALGLRNQAIDAAWAAVTAVEHIRGRFSTAALRRSYGAARSDAYLMLIELLLAEGEVDRAMEAADAARGRPLRAAPPGEPDSGSRSYEALASWQQREAALRNADYLTFALDSLERLSADERGADYEEELARIREPLLAARAGLARSVVSQSSAKREDPFLAGGTLSADSLKALLGPGEAAVQYLVTDRGIHAFVVSEQEASHHWIAEAAPQLEARVRLARSLLANPESDIDATRTVLATLYDVLIRPLEDVLQHAERLTVVGDGHLVYVPFAALWDHEDGRHLLQRWSVAYAPSAAAWVALRLDHVDPGRGSGTAGSSAFLAPFPDELPGSREEANDVAAAVPGSSVFTGEEATERAIRSALQQSTVVHVASHAELNPRNPLRSRIRLADGTGAASGDDGWLEVSEVIRHAVKSDLVYLSGCETDLSPAGTTTFSPGDDLSTLAQAFLFAGAKSVVATLWPIRDRAAADFASAFYEARGSQSTSEALVAAQKRMLETERYAHPFYWAAYRISGAAEPYDSQTSSAGAVQPR